MTYIRSYISSFLSEDPSQFTIWGNQEPNKRDLFLIGTTGSMIGVGLGIGGYVGLNSGIVAFSQKTSMDGLSETLMASADLIVGAATLALGASVVYFTKKFFSTTLNQISKSQAAASLKGRSISPISDLVKPNPSPVVKA